MEIRPGDYTDVSELSVSDRRLIDDAFVKAGAGFGESGQYLGVAELTLVGWASDTGDLFKCTAEAPRYFSGKFISSMDILWSLHHEAGGQDCSSHAVEIEQEHTEPESGNRTIAFTHGGPTLLTSDGSMSIEASNHGVSITPTHGGASVTLSGADVIDEVVAALQFLRTVHTGMKEWQDTMDAYAKGTTDPSEEEA